MKNKLSYFFQVLRSINFKNSLNDIKHCDVLFFCHDANRGISLNNQAYSPLLDSIRDEFEEKGLHCVTIAHPWSEIIGKRGYGSPIAMNRSYFISKILDKLTIKLSYEHVLKLYEQIIIKSSPKLIITIGCNNQLCEAARNLRVFHAELLHGIGYDSIPWDWDKKEKKHLPQCILSLDEVSTQNFIQLAKHEIIIKDIPHPFLRRFQSNNIDKIPKEWSLPKRDRKYAKEILISLQWGYKYGVDEHDFLKGVLNNGLFYDEIEEVIKCTQDTIFWRFRFHPIQYRQPKKYKDIFDFINKFVDNYKNCDWEDSTYTPLPSLLLQCSGHITMFSMTSYEAAYLGVPSLALCPSLRKGGVYENVFNDLVAKGYVIKHKPQVDFILNWLKDVEKIPPLLGNLKYKESTAEWLLSQIYI